MTPFDMKLLRAVKDRREVPFTAAAALQAKGLVTIATECRGIKDEVIRFSVRLTPAGEAALATA